MIHNKWNARDLLIQVAASHDVEMSEEEALEAAKIVMKHAPFKNDKVFEDACEKAFQEFHHADKKDKHVRKAKHE